MNGKSKSPFEYHERGVTWNPAQVELEAARLQALPYFVLESWSVKGRRLQVIGLLSHVQQETGREETLRVRMEYPKEYPWDIPSAFDHDRQFVPSADGHQYPDYQLCLSFPLRPEFHLGSESLAAEVLQASLIWLNKRCIFQRLGAWPGVAEEHGYVRPLIPLLREEAKQSLSLSACAWCDWVLAELVSPNPEGHCPCLSGKPFETCHRRLLWLAIFYQCSAKAMREHERRATRKAA